MSRGRRRDFPSGFSISARRLRKDTHPPDLITSQAPGACRAPSRCQQETVSPASGTQTSDRGLATLDLQEAAAHSPAARRTRAFTGVGFSPSFSANRRSVRPVGSKQGPPREKARQPRARRSSRRCVGSAEAPPRVLPRFACCGVCNLQGHISALPRCSGLRLAGGCAVRTAGALPRLGGGRDTGEGTCPWGSVGTGVGKPIGTPEAAGYGKRALAQQRWAPPVHVLCVCSRPRSS